MKGSEDMKKLIRTVPENSGDDYDIHEDIMELDVDSIVSNESNDSKKDVGSANSKNNIASEEIIEGDKAIRDLTNKGCIL